MIFISIILLLILAFVARRIGQSWFFPPVVYALYWAFILLGSVLPVISKGELTSDSLLVFLLGAFCFAIGGMIPLTLLARGRQAVTRLSEKRTRGVQVFIIGFSVVLALMVPFFVRSIQQMANALRIDNFAIGSRFILGMPDQGGIPRIFRSWTSLAVILAYYAAWQYRGSNRDKLALTAAVISPLIMNILTFGRTPVFMLVVGVLAILLLRKRISVLRASLIFSLALLISFGIGLALKKGPELRVGESPFWASMNNLTVHHLGGPVAFGQVMNNPELVGERGLSLRFFTQALNSFGVKGTLPNNVLDYIGSDLGNVYTWYFAYWLDGSWLGVTLFSILSGFFSGLVYVFARRGNFVAGAAWGLVISAILDSAVIDLLFGSAIPWLLVVAAGALLYYVPLPRISRQKRTARYSRVSAQRPEILKDRLGG